MQLLCYYYYIIVLWHANEHYTTRHTEIVKYHTIMRFHRVQHFKSSHIGIFFRDKHLNIEPECHTLIRREVETSKMYRFPNNDLVAIV